MNRLENNIQFCPLNENVNVGRYPSNIQVAFYVKRENFNFPLHCETTAA